MRKVLAAIDSSAAATPVLATAAMIAKLYDAKLEALHMTDNSHEEAARSLARAAGVVLETMRGPDSAAGQLIARAETDAEVMAMVIGARGLPLVSRRGRPVGSTALALITKLKKPLVIVPPEARIAGTAIDRILVPLDGTRASAIALESTIQLARAANVEVVILHVHHRGAVPRFCDHAQHETEAWVREFLARNCPLPRDVELKLRAGVPGESVLEVADNVKAKLIALCWSQVLSPDRASVIREVLERSSIPVLLLPIPASHELAR